MTAYYNEIDPYAAAWLRNLIGRGLIAPGVVDERSIADIQPADLDGFTQCHFFAGIGVWSYALRLAGWSDDRPVWTGSCPCQPFSAAGKRKGFDDARHLWPEWFRLIGERRPVVVFGEQVANGGGLTWFDAVQADLEGAAYTVGAVDLPACGVGAPHIRNRLFFVADANKITGRQGRAFTCGSNHRSDAVEGTGLSGSIGPSLVAESHQRQRGWLADTTSRNIGCGTSSGRQQGDSESESCRDIGLVANDGSERQQECDVQLRQPEHAGQAVQHPPSPSRRSIARFVGDDDDDARLQGWSVPASGCADQRTAWSASDFVWCRDGKWRPVEPGTFPLVDVAPARVGRLRAYGNAIVAEAAKEFVKAYLDAG